MLLEFFFFFSEKLLTMASNDHAVLDLGDEDLQFTENNYNKSSKVGHIPRMILRGEATSTDYFVCP